MPDSALHHHTSEENNQAGGDKPFLQTVYDPEEDDANNSSSNSGGRKPLPTFDDIEDPEEKEFAFNKQRIEENYPFFGTLMKRVNGIMKRQEVITKSNPQNIEYVKDRYKGGAYQLRQKQKGGEERRINFNVSGVEKPKQRAEPQQQAIDEKFIADLRKELKQEIRSDYQDLIQRLEKRLEARNDELDELSRKNRKLVSELAEIERRSARTSREETKEFKQTIDRLKQERQNLEFEVFKLEQELKYSDADKGFDLKGMLKEAANNPQLQQLLAPLLAKIFGADPMPQAAAALNGQRANPQQPTSQGQHHSPDNDVSDTEQQQEDQPQANQQSQNPQQQMQQLVQQFKTGVINTVASSMVNGEPGASELKTLVIQGVKELESNGITPEPAMWIQIAKRLVEFAVERSVTAEKAANTIKPILEQLDGAADNLKYLPAKGAAHALINMYSIEVTEPQKDFLIQVLEQFKQQLANSE